jgi:hypothetical protein
MILGPNHTMGTGKWLAVAALFFALAQLADRGRHHDRRHRMRLVSWRWDQIAEYRRRQTPVDRLALKVARPVGHLALPLTVLALGALVAAGLQLLT